MSCLVVTDLLILYSECKGSYTCPSVSTDLHLKHVLNLKHAFSFISNKQENIVAINTTETNILSFVLVLWLYFKRLQTLLKSK